MASSAEFLHFVLECLESCEVKTSYKKMFGEYCIYLHNPLPKPAFLLCDDCLFVKKYEFLHEILADFPCGIPFPKAREWYILDCENNEILMQVVEKLKENL